MIPKPGGGERPLGIPTIRDRVVQTAAKLVLEPIFEADLEPAAYGYRPKRSGTDAIKEVHALLCRGYTDVVDADLSKYFDTIPHQDLMRSVARRIVDRHVLRLIKLWLKAPVEERDGDGTRRMTGGKGSTLRHAARRGGQPAARQPVHEPLPEALAARADGASAYRAHIVAYADDFVILSRGHAAEALAWTRQVMARLGLALNEAKTSVRDARRERFDFLGYTFGPHRYRKDGHWYLGASPSKKSVLRLTGKVSDLLVPGNMGAWHEVRDRLNRLVARLGRVLQLRHAPAWPIGRSTITSMTGSATSWSGVTRCRRAAPSATPMGWCSASSACCGSAGFILAPCRVPRGEASRKAGCGKSARPV